MVDKFGIDRNTLTPNLRRLYDDAAKAMSYTNLYEVDHIIEFDIFKRTAKQKLNSGSADFTQEDFNRIFGLEKSNEAKPTMKSSDKPQEMQQKKVMSLGEEAILKIALKGNFSPINDKLNVRAKGNNVYEVEYKDLGNKKRNDIITINPDDNSFIIKYSEDDVILYKKYNEDKKQLKEEERQSGEVVIYYQWEYDNNGNLVKEIRDDVFGYKCYEYTYNENNELTTKIVKDREGKQISK